MVIGISPLVDFAFKLMFGSPEHTRVTIHFLNAMLAGQPKITKIQLLNPFLDKEWEFDKLSVLDILATDEHGRMLNIEMQTTVPAGLPERLTYYAADLYASQLVEGQPYTDLRPSITICVLSTSMFPNIPELHLDFRLREERGQLLTDDLQIHLLELPKLQLSAQNVASASPIEQWAYFLLNVENLTPDDIKRLFPDIEFQEAAGVLVMISLTPRQQRVYDAFMKLKRDEATRVVSTEIALEEALRKGEEKGRLEGEERGRRVGELLGRIAVLQDLLGLAEPTSAELSLYDPGRLSELADQLQHQVRNRGH